MLHIEGVHFAIFSLSASVNIKPLLPSQIGRGSPRRHPWDTEPNN